jgi:hypothetical protein
VRIIDSVISPEAYAKRAIETGAGILSSCEHGWQGPQNIYYDLAKQYNLKFVMSAEAYWVKDRHEKDLTNCHIWVGAKNENGREAINNALSEANLTGFYRQPRLDKELILALPRDDVWVTSACIAGWKYDDAEEIFKEYSDHFGGNFFLEVQYHNTEPQIALNQKILNLHDREGIPLIAGCDSHYIFETQAQDRTDLIESKGWHYPEEDGWFLDYPDTNTTYSRFVKQGVLDGKQIEEAINNTNVFLNVETYDSDIFTNKIKIPSLYPGWTQEEKDREYERLVWNGWDAYKANVPSENWPHYEDEIKSEIATVEECKMSDYFILNHEIIKKGKENGGWLTKSGRGCFDGETLVHTISGMKPIKDVKIGDRVFDMNGKIQKVSNVLSYQINEPMVRVNYAYNSNTQTPIVCTNDHKFLVKRSGTLAWIEAKELTSDDYLCIPHLKMEDNSSEVIDLNKYNVFGFDYDDKYIYEYNPYKNNYYKYSPTDVAKNIGCGASTIEKIANGERKGTTRNKKIVEGLLRYTGFKTIDDYSLYIKRCRTILINRFIPNDELTNVWIGMMYGDGFSSENKICSGLAICNNGKKNVTNKDVFYVMASRFGLEVKGKKDKFRDLEQLEVNSKIVSNFIHTEFFVSRKGYKKSFNPNLFFQNKNNLKGLLKGLRITDGSSCEATRESFDNTSESLINAYRIL